MKMKYLPAPILLLLLLLSCVKKRTEIEKKFRPLLAFYAKEIKSADEERIHSITTTNGFNELSTYSVSFTDKSFLNYFSALLLEYKVFDEENRDSVIVFSLGKEDIITGATDGYLFLKREQGNYQVDEYRPGK